MTNDRITFRAISFAMAAMVTFTMLTGIDTLATSQHAAQDLMAQTATVATRG